VHDYDFIFRALCRYGDKFRFLDEKQYLYYRVHSDNTINKSYFHRYTEDLWLHFVNTTRFLAK